jgi:sulfur-oxidizing protein SoxX
MATAANNPPRNDRFVRRAAAAMTLCAGSALWVMDAAAQALVPYQVEAGEIRSPLADAGDAARGRAVVLSRESGNCFLCHAFPDAGDAPLGNIGPPMSGVGARLSSGQLRLRMVDSARVSPHSVMPAYYRVEGLRQVAAAYRGKPLLTAQQVEDVVAYLAQLRD